MQDFQFKQFVVRQRLAAMKVGTDGTLLGAWAHCSGQRILDIGSGTGVVALMLAQRFAQAQIDAIEINLQAAEEAQKNFAASPWSNRLSLYAQGLQSFSASEGYDLIVSNPPFYPEAQFSKALNKDRRQARSSLSLGFEELLEHSLALLAPAGQLAIILPTAQALYFHELAQEAGLFLHRRCDFISRLGKAPKRLLLQWGQAPIEKPQQQEIIMRQGPPDYAYADSYRQLLTDFLIIF
ncbi:putative O-methyltransferase [Saprospira grandis DSM 2844]|uniref:tRNA1(Val) (adenine(37)-N6)-methyltransferase n=1 Tax=Saprospira grandis DSM 2844 TaxID=694433 RepID=J1I041_9BACT|nr:methyltransferase [Saprospira grandis]EJF52025.1 putative O-methyltransferase [Saprospira grandis DSM 2844]